jgi:hypothetical protein
LNCIANLAVLRAVPRVQEQNSCVFLTEFASALLSGESPLISAGVAVLQEVVQLIVLLAALGKVLRLNKAKTNLQHDPLMGVLWKLCMHALVYYNVTNTKSHLLNMIHNGGSLEISYARKCLLKF